MSGNIVHIPATHKDEGAKQAENVAPGCNDTDVNMDGADISLNSTGGDDIVGSASDKSLDSTQSGSGVSNDSGASVNSSDIERLYETVSDISRRQKGHFPDMVPGNCLIDTDMVKKRVLECSRLLEDDDIIGRMQDHAESLTSSLDTFGSAVRGVMKHLTSIADKACSDKEKVCLELMDQLYGVPSGTVKPSSNMAPTIPLFFVKQANRGGLYCLSHPADVQARIAAAMVTARQCQMNIRSQTWLFGYNSPSQRFGDRRFVALPSYKSRGKKFQCLNDSVSFLKSMKPERYFTGQGQFDYPTFASDAMHWSGCVTSNLGILHRVPFFGKRVCDGNFTRHDFVKGVQELCAANSTDPAAFVDAVGEALYDQYEFQKLTKKISSESVTYITHLTKLVHKLCELQIEKERLSACFADLEEHYLPKFRSETKMSSLISRYERCHQHYFQSYVSGIPGLNVVGNVKLSLNLADIGLELKSDFRSEWGQGRRMVTSDMYHSAKKRMENFVKDPNVLIDEPPSDSFRTHLGKDFQYSFANLLTKKRVRTSGASDDSTITPAKRGQRLCSTPAITSRRPSNFPVRRLHQERSARGGGVRPVSVVTTGVTVERHLTRELQNKKIPNKEIPDKESVSEIAEGARRGDKKAADKSVALLGALESWERKNDNARQTADVTDDLTGDFDGQLSTVTSDDETMDMTDVNQLLYSHED